MITVYHLRPSRAQRIIWLLEEIGVDYRVEAYDRDASFRAPAALREIHPLGKSPMLRDGDTLLVESGAIVEYLVERYAPQLAPAPGAPTRPVYLQWLHWTEGSMAAWLVMDLIVNSGMVPGVVPGPLSGMLGAEIGRALDWVETELTGRAFACGDDFTAADPMLGWTLDFAASRGHLGSRPAIAGYLARIHAREAHQRAAAKAA